MPLRDNGFEPGWLDNRNKVYKIGPNGEQYLARIEDSQGNILEEFKLPEGVEKVTRPAPSYEELKEFAERENYKNLANKGKKEFHTSYTRMKGWLTEAELLERPAPTRAEEPPEVTMTDVLLDETEKKETEASTSPEECLQTLREQYRPNLSLLKPTTPSPISEIEVLQVAWISDVVDSGFTAKEKVGLILNICCVGAEV